MPGNPGGGLRDYQAYVQLDRQVRRLEQGQQQRGGTVGTDAYAFNLSPTCPPSTSIMFRGGLAWWPAYSLYPGGFFIPSYEVDLTDPDKTSIRHYTTVSYSYTFVNPYWYAPCLVVITQSQWPPPEVWPTIVPDFMIYLRGKSAAPYFDEFETAAEAEIAVREIVGERVAYYGIVAGGLILRNNGNTTNSNQYMPIDVLNRGRSYLFGGKRYGWELG